MPSIAREFGTSPGSVVWVANSYQATSAALMITFASLGNILGKRKVYLLGIAGFTLTSVGCALSTSLPELVLLRMVQGISYAAMVSIGIGMYRVIFPPNELGSILGINALVLAFGAAAGPSIGGFTLAYLSWPWLFIVNIPIGLIALVLGIFALPKKQGSGSVFDLTGAFLSAGAISLAVIIVDQLGIWPGWLSISLLLLVGLMLLTFVYMQSRSLNPLLPLSIFNSKRFTLATATSLSSFVAQGSAVIALPFLFQTTYHYGVLGSAFLFTPWPLTVAFAAPVAGRLADRFNAMLLSTLGILVFAAGLASLALMASQPEQWNIMWRVGLCGLGFGFFQAPNNREMLSNVTREMSGAASGILSTARSFGQSLGAALVAAVLASGSLEFVGLTRFESMHVALWLASLVAGGAGVLSILALIGFWGGGGHITRPGL